MTLHWNFGYDRYNSVSKDIAYLSQAVSQRYVISTKLISNAMEHTDIKLASEPERVYTCLIIPKGILVSIIVVILYSM